TGARASHPAKTPASRATVADTKARGRVGMAARRGAGRSGSAGICLTGLTLTDPVGIWLASGPLEAESPRGTPGRTQQSKQPRDRGFLSPPRHIPEVPIRIELVRPATPRSLPGLASATCPGRRRLYHRSHARPA